jgi:3-phenylpropionate/trans-cinnamate dioxygenase ferredoxin reductase subunit
VNRVLIVGASMGGLRTAESLRRSGFDGEITIVGAEKHLPYNRPPLSKALLAEDKELDSVAFKINTEELKADFILGNPAQSVDIENKEATLSSNEKLSYDFLVAATGLRSRKMDFQNLVESGRFSLRTYDDAKRIRSSVATGKHVVILGAGFIGLELAATLRKLGCSVDVVAMETTPLAPIIGELFGKEIQKRHEAKGVHFHMNNSVKDLIGDSFVTGVILGDGKSLECDIFIEAVGSLPNTEWLEGSVLDKSNGVLTDKTLRAVNSDGKVIESFFAVGDIARFPYVNQQLPARRIEHWNIPIEGGKRVGREIANAANPGSVGDFNPTEQFNPLPSFWSDQYEMSILSYGEPKIADEIELIKGSLDTDFIFSYRRQGALVGAAGIGLRQELNKLRNEICL